MDSFQRAKLAGAVSVMIDLENNPKRRKQLISLMNSLRSNSLLSSEEKALINELDVIAVSHV